MDTTDLMGWLGIKLWTQLIQWDGLESNYPVKPCHIFVHVTI